VNLPSVRRGTISVSLCGAASNHNLMELSEAVASSIFTDGAVGTVGGVSVPMDETTLLVGSIAFLSLVGLAVMANEDHDGRDSKKQTVTKTISSSSAESSTTKATSKKEPSVASSSKSLETTTTTKPSSSSTTPAMENSTSVSDIDTNIVLDDSEGQESSEALLAAFTMGNEGLLRQSLSALMGRLRSARTSLQRERAMLHAEQSRRESIEQTAQRLALEVRELEDAYELEQNNVQRTLKQLETTQQSLYDTQVQLSTTQRELERVTTSLMQLETERQSLKQLTRVAYQLSKDRLRRRVQKIKERFISSPSSSSATNTTDVEENKEDESGTTPLPPSN
jgi:chromosome segregation ATPase